VKFVPGDAIHDAEALLESHLGLAPRSPEAAVLRLLIELCAQVVRAEEGSLLVLDRGESPPRELVFAMTVGSPESERTLRGQRVRLGEGITGLAALTHEVQIGAPLYDGVRQAQRGEAAPGQPSSVIAAPMLAGDELVGVITAVTFEPGRRFTSADAALYARGASVAGLVVDQRRRLDALGEGGAHGGEEAERRVAEAAARLARRGPAELATLARLLEAVEALAASSGPRDD
jgi:GAF domain-containing protein